MHWFTVENNTPVQHLPGTMIVMPDGSKQPHNITALWSAADLLAAGERFDNRAANADPMIEAIITGLAEVKGITVPEAKVWLRGLV